MLQFNSEANSQDFVSEIRDRVGISNLHVNRICRALNLALDEYTNIAVESSPDGLGAQTTTDSTTSAVYIDVDDYLTVERVALQENGTYTWLTRIQNADDIPEGTGTPTSYMTLGSRLYLYPTPVQSNTYRVWHNVKATHFVPTDTTATAGKTHQEFLILSACMKLMQSTNDSVYTAIRDAYMFEKQKVERYFALHHGSRRVSVEFSAPN